MIGRIGVAELGEEIFVGAGFSSTTDSLKCFPTWILVEVVNKVDNADDSFVVVIVVDKYVEVGSMIDIVVDLNAVVQYIEVMCWVVVDIAVAGDNNGHVQARYYDYCDLNSSETGCGLYLNKMNTID